MMEKPLHPAYREAVFEIPGGDRPSDFWVITAFNPDGCRADADVNEAADRRLREELASLGPEVFRVTGRSPDGSHSEPGWGVSCDEATALRIGREFRQDAMFHFHGGGIDLVNCRNGSREFVDAMENRVLASGDQRS